LILFSAFFFLLSLDFQSLSAILLAHNPLFSHEEVGRESMLWFGVEVDLKGGGSVIYIVSSTDLTNITLYRIDLLLHCGTLTPSAPAELTSLHRDNLLNGTSLLASFLAYSPIRAQRTNGINSTKARVG
jgi:hypothetical protein